MPRVYLGLHEYYLAGVFPINDTWHTERYARVAATLGDDLLPVLVGEWGEDGGEVGETGQGYKSHGGVDEIVRGARTYQAALPVYVAGVACFLCGAGPGWGWDGFDVAGTAAARLFGSMARFGWQTQWWSPEALDDVRNAPPFVLKMLQPGAVSFDVAAAWRQRRPDGLLIVRDCFPNENLDAGKVDDLLRLAEPLRALRPILEIPINEGWQTDAAAVARLADYTVTAGQRIVAAGFDCCIGNFGEGNPPDLGMWEAFRPALRWARGAWDADPTNDSAAWRPARLAVPQEEPVTDPATLCTMAMWRQGTDLRAEQRTPEGLATALVAGGFTVAIADVLQGVTPQRTFSQTQVDVGSPAEAAALAMDLFANGVRFWPMQNVRGQDIPAEVAALKTYADAIRAETGESTVVLDFEALYAYFFEPTGVLADAIRALVAEVDRVFPPGHWTVILCPDPRQLDREYALDLFPQHWVLMPQTYNLDFQESWQECYRSYLPASTTADLADVGDPTPEAAVDYDGRTVVPMLQGDLSTLTMREIWRWLALHHRWACVWGFGALAPQRTPGALDDFAVAKAVAGPYETLPVAVPVTPPPPPPPPGPDPEVLHALDVLWTAVGPNVDAQRAIVAVKVALGLQS